MTKKISVPSEDQETSFNRGRNEKFWTIYTNDSTEKTRLRKAGVTWNEADEDSEGGIFVKLPAKAITYRNISKMPSAKAKKERKQRDPNKPKRVLTPEHLAKLAAGRAKKKAEKNEN